MLSPCSYFLIIFALTPTLSPSSFIDNPEAERARPKRSPNMAGFSFGLYNITLL
jgi:hypothetical protein